MSEKMRKYRFAVGLCGPQIIYTNIIKAVSPEEAARKYYEGMGESFTEELVAELASRARLVEEVVRKKNGFFDVAGAKIKEGDTVAFVHRYEEYRLKIDTGKVTRFTKAKAFVENADGEEFGFVSNKDSKVLRIVKIPDNIETYKGEDAETTAIDALGQKIEIGNEVVYLGAFRVGGGNTSFNYVGKVTDIDNRYISAEGMNGRKMFKSIVVIKK